MAHRAPGEEQVGQLLEGRPAVGHDLELGAVELRAIARLDEQAAVDALEIEPGDAVVAQPFEAGAAHGEHGKALLLGQDLARGLRQTRCDDGLVGIARNRACGLGVDLAIEGNDRTERRHRVALERLLVRLG